MVKGKKALIGDTATGLAGFLIIFFAMLLFTTFIFVTSEKNSSQINLASYESNNLVSIEALNALLQTNITINKTQPLASFITDWRALHNSLEEQKVLGEEIAKQVSEILEKTASGSINNYIFYTIYSVTKKVVYEPGASPMLMEKGEFVRNPYKTEDRTIKSGKFPENYRSIIMQRLEQKFADAKEKLTLNNGDISIILYYYNE